MAFAVGWAAALAWYNNLAGRRRWHRRWYVVANLAATAAALQAARASGMSVTDLGLRRDRLRPGLRLGSRLAAPVTAGLMAAALLPATRPLLRDQRTIGLDRRQLAFQFLLRIPVGTVAWEETAFRGVLQAALRRLMAEPAAIAVTSAMFGIWHIRPTAQAILANQPASTPRAVALATGAGVAATGAAGVILSWSRARSGSLAAPVTLHLAANCGGLLASSLIRLLPPRPAPLSHTGPPTWPATACQTVGESWRVGRTSGAKAARAGIPALGRIVLPGALEAQCPAWLGEPPETRL